MSNYNEYNYKVGDYLLIYTQEYKSNRYIGQIQSINKDNTKAELSVFIFIEDTKDGSTHSRSYAEVFRTDKSCLYAFSGDEIVVELVSLGEFIQRKYIDKEVFKNALFFSQQSYNINDNTFDPEIERICYCQQFFNPDNPFKICKCGSFFHPKCFMDADTNKCWFRGCTMDCTKFFSNDELSDKKKELLLKPNSPMRANRKENTIHSRKNSEIDKKKERDNNEPLSLEEIAQIERPKNKKNNKEQESTVNLGRNNNNMKIDSFIKKEKDYTNNNNNNQRQERPAIFSTINTSSGSNNIKPERVTIDLSGNNNRNINKFSFTSPKSPLKLFEVSNEGPKISVKTEEEIERQRENEKKRVSKARENGRNIIFENILKGIKRLQKDKSYLKQLELTPHNQEKLQLIEENDKEKIEIEYKNIANDIENNLFNNSNQKLISAYYDFLQEFASLKNDAVDILYKIILGLITPEQVSKFKGEDFLSEEKKKQKEEIKKKEFQKMIIEKNEIKVISNKGRMLSEVQDIIGVEKISNNQMQMEIDNQISLRNEEKPYLPNGKKNPRYPYYNKLKNLSEKFPEICENEIKFMVDMQEPDEGDIRNKLNGFIQGSLCLEEQEEFFSYRNIKLKNRAEENYLKKVKEDGIVNKEKVGKKKEEALDDYMKEMAFDMKFY